MALQRNLRSSYIPIVLFKPSSRAVGFLVPDQISASYNDIRSEVLEYTRYQVTDTTEALPDSIAFNYYGDESLWWVICLYNKIVNPLTDLVSGMWIKIPDNQKLEIYLARKLTPTSKNQLKNTFVSI